MKGFFVCLYLYGIKNRAPEFQVLCFYQRFFKCLYNQTARVTLPERRQRVQA